MTSEEVWKDVVGFPGYRVSSKANVSGKMVAILKQRPNPDGYACVWLSVDGVVTAKKVATLVCEAFHGARPEGLVCAHNDGDKTNNMPANLRWTTQKDNIADQQRHGTRMMHDGHYRALLSVEAVAKIKEMHAAARRGMKKVPAGALAEIAARFGVKPQTVNKMLRGETWAFVGLLSGKALSKGPTP